MNERNIAAGIFTAISLMLMTFGILAAFGYQAHPNHSVATHMGFAATFFFLGIFVSPAIVMDEFPDWFNNFRRKYYYLSVIFMVLTLIIAAYDILIGF